MHVKRRKNPKAKRPKHQDKDLDPYIEQAWAAGWWCERRSNNYIHCYPDDGDGAPVIVKSTPSSSHYQRNLRAQFRRAGLEI